MPRPRAAVYKWGNSNLRASKRKKVNRQGGKKTKVAIVVGARPEIIKMAPVILALRKYPTIKLDFIHSGQHYDEDMSEVFLHELGLPEPTNLGVGSGPQGEQTARILAGCEKIFRETQPDLVLSEGDTNTTLASALASVKMHIPYGHVEAGLRCFDKRMPEEINRIIADCCAALSFAPTKRSALNLIFESISPSQIFVTGNTIVDAVIQHLEIAKKRSKILKELGVRDEKIAILTLHRAENTDELKRLRRIISAILKIEGCNVIFPIHPRTKKVLTEAGLWKDIKTADHIILTDPLGYLDFILLLSKSALVLTDSGGVQEEAVTLKVPCLTLRYSTERPETIEVGGNTIVNDDPNMIAELANRIIGDDDFRTAMIPSNNPYGDGHAGERIAEICVEKLDHGLRYKSPIYLKSGSGKYLLLDAKEVSESGDQLFCYFDQNGKPIFPSKGVFPSCGWKALVLRGE